MDERSENLVGEKGLKELKKVKWHLIFKQGADQNIKG
jgi:hypothetical protein